MSFCVKPLLLWMRTKTFGCSFFYYFYYYYFGFCFIVRSRGDSIICLRVDAGGCCFAIWRTPKLCEQQQKKKYIHNRRNPYTLGRIDESQIQDLKKNSPENFMKIIPIFSFFG